MTSEDPTNPPHPGEVLYRDFLKPQGIEILSLAIDINYADSRLRAICRGEIPVNAELALRLARHLGTAPEYWLTLQQEFDLAAARRTYSDIALIVPLAKG